MTGKNVVELIMKLKDELSGPLGRFEDRFKRLSSAIKTGALVIGGAIIGLVGNSIRLAASFEEMEAKFEAVFKEYAPAARAELKRLADELGRSSNKWIGYAAIVQDTLVPLGYARDQASELSVEIVSLAADLSSFNDIPIETVIRDLQSGLVGNIESLLKYGIVAKDLERNTYALNNGIWDGVGAMDAQEKAAATLGIIYASTADAQGDAARTAGSFTNTMRQAEDQLYDFQIELGQRLLPVIAELVSTHMPGFIGALENIVPPLVTFVTNVANLADGLINVVSTAKQADEAMILFEGNLGNLGNMLTGQVADGIYTAEEALEIWNSEVDTMAKTLPFDELLEFKNANHLNSTAIIEEAVAVQVFRDKLVDLTLVQLQNLRVLMQSMSMLPGFSQVSRAAFEQLNAEVTEKLIPSVTALGAAAGAALTDLKTLFETEGTITTPSGTLTDEEVSRQIARSKFMKAAALEDMAEIEAQEAGALARRTIAESEAIERRKQANIELREAMLESEEEYAVNYLQIVNGVISGITSVYDNLYNYKAQKINQNRSREIAAINASTKSEEKKASSIAMINAKYDDMEKSAKAAMKPVKVAEAISNIALGVTQALASSPPPFNFIQAAAVSAAGAAQIAIITAQKYQAGGKILHAQGGLKVPDTGPYGDRHIALVERGEIIYNQQQVLQGMLPGSSRNVSVVVYHQPFVSTGSAGEMVTLGQVVIEAIEKAGGNVG
jgi:hypothetical protein